MRRAVFVFAAALLLCGGAWGAVQKRDPASRASGASPSVCGNVLLDEGADGACAYVPYRFRRAEGDGGAIVKFRLEVSSARRVWSSRVSAPRRVLVPPASGGVFVSGPLTEVSTVGESALPGGLDAEESARLAVFYRNKALAAPYPAALALAEGVLYAQTDDGLICAFDAESGGELWAFLPPHVALKERAQAVLASPGSLPWLAAGALTAEAVSVAGERRVLLWGSLGAAARGLFCLDVSDAGAPVFLWAFEEDGGAAVFWGGNGGAAPGLGFSAAAPLVAPVGGETLAIVPTGAGVSGRLLGFDPLSGCVAAWCAGQAGVELALSPLGITSAGGRLVRLVLGDAAGGVQEFVRQEGFFAFAGRLDLREVCGDGSVELVFSPIACRLPRGLWLAFAASCASGTVVAVCPAPSGGQGWSAEGRHCLLAGFDSVTSALCVDGLLFLLGREGGRAVVKVIDVAGARLSQSLGAVGEGGVLAAVGGRPVLLVPDGDGVKVSELAVAHPGGAGVLYTLFY